MCVEEEGVDEYGEERDAGDGEKKEGEGEHADTGTTTAGVEMVKCGRTTIDLLPLYSTMGRGKVIWVPCMFSESCWRWCWWCCWCRCWWCCSWVECEDGQVFSEELCVEEWKNEEDEGVDDGDKQGTIDLRRDSECCWLEMLPDCKFKSEEEETVRRMGLGLVVEEDEDKEERGRDETDGVESVDDKPIKDCPIVECGKVVVSMVELCRQLCNSWVVSSQGRLHVSKNSSQRASEQASE